MKKVLVTGAQGFIGRHLITALSKQSYVQVKTFTSHDSFTDLAASLSDVDMVYHLAGVNRPEKVEDFYVGNTSLTQTIVELLAKAQNTPTIVLSSSTQATLDNPYGISKKQAENILQDYQKSTGAQVYLYRLTNVFGSGCRPNYNSAVATFCYNIAHGHDVHISDRNRVLELVYVDDVVTAFLKALESDLQQAIDGYVNVKPTYRISLGELVDKIYQLHDLQKKSAAINFNDQFTAHLYTTYVSYLPNKGF